MKSKGRNMVSAAESSMVMRILEERLGKPVLIRLKNGRSFRGILHGFDQHVNLVLKDAEDVTEPNDVKKLGMIVLRGDNVVIISPS